MDIPEPKWRVELYETVRRSAERPQCGATRRHLLQLLETYTTDHFDALVQAIARKDLNDALAILQKRYPGSLERQQIIEAALRGELEGS